MLNLYFLDNDGKQHLVAENVAEENAGDIVEQDLAERRPGMKSFYQRMWWDQYFRKWIDYGSHTEFYILQKPEQALNVVEDKKSKKVECHEDYCEIVK